MKKINFIDIFCGAGGLSFSFKKRNHNLKLAVDIDPISIKTLKTNFPQSCKNIINEDIIELIKQRKSDIFKNKIDLLMGGPPCQGFSTANRQNILNDPRNELYNYFLEFAKKINPKFILIENVVGIKAKANDILTKLDGIGYQADFRILQAYDFGIPQNRRRVFFFAIKKNQSRRLIENFFESLENFKKESIKFLLKDALFGLRPLKPKKFKNDNKNEYFESGFNIEKISLNKSNSYLKLINLNKKINYVYNHMARYNNERDIKIFSKLPQGADSTHKSIQDIMPYKKRNKIFKDKYFKLNNHKVSKTITSHMKFDCNMYIHPTQARGLTPREAARIQSFPDNYFFEGTKSQCYSQIGNAVPPLLSKYICMALEKIND
jgi:DNA (cytosine-5)-methyltransferase 1